MERLVLSLIVLACFLLLVYGMRVGWRRKARSQSVLVPPFPRVPGEPGEPELVAKGLYVSTTTAGNWQDRIVTRGAGLRGRARLRLCPGGVEVDRAGAPGFWIPRESITGAGLRSAIAGKVMGTDSLLVITWRAGDVELDTGFRSDEPDDYPQWIDRLRIKGGAR
ncbi:MAG TPA: transporter [Amycolatopsis sp.]|uniref:PH-like domain-containing protein n=1 Tax=Amycolatopsis sp. TaxID=37632 RepID=UPI002B485A53|nr:transporter [Amycolatopsis sp.]HKS46780.1 transporter [Amycolatopsis sp.]